MIMRDNTQQYNNPWISKKEWPTLRQENESNNANVYNVKRNENTRQSYRSQYSQIVYRKPEYRITDRRDESIHYNEPSTSKANPIQNRGSISHHADKIPTEQGRKEYLTIEEKRVKTMENIIEKMDELTTDEDNMIKQLQRMIEMAERKITEILNKRRREKGPFQVDYPTTAERIGEQIYYQSPQQQKYQ
ncbi:hypothetical protein PV327_007396 [Microctonus hyperodae]|uniref:Uncharacterized protein n=1 Tax=Microctonus hyperodae TaxID=165561 RepID=A0AA39KYK8_MICHY|nr:hypothetical protein PV327_007396 [Microctonus hyperodae]